MKNNNKQTFGSENVKNGKKGSTPARSAVKTAPAQNVVVGSAKNTRYSGANNGKNMAGAKNLLLEIDELDEREEMQPKSKDDLSLEKSNQKIDELDSIVKSYKASLTVFIASRHALVCFLAGYFALKMRCVCELIQKVVVKEANADAC